MDKLDLMNSGLRKDFSALNEQFAVTTPTVPEEWVFEFYNQRRTAQERIKEGKYKLKCLAVELRACSRL